MTTPTIWKALDALEDTGAFDGLTGEELGAVHRRLSALARQALDRESAVDNAALAAELEPTTMRVADTTSEAD